MAARISSTTPWNSKKRQAQIRAFGASLGLKPDHDRLLHQALTHRSLESEAPYGDNERLELLGDSVLALVVVEELYRSHTEHSEGTLTQLKALYVCEGSLADAARRLGLGALLAIGPGDEATGGRSRPSTLSDAFEAVLGALYLCRGLDAAREFVVREILQQVDPVEVRDPKSRLQEHFQALDKTTPTYHLQREEGPPHDPTFWCEVRAGGRALGEGKGRSKKVAEQEAARAALAVLARDSGNGDAEPPPDTVPSRSEGKCSSGIMAGKAPL